LKRHHDDILADHFDVKKTIELLNRKYHWSRMIKYVKFYIKTCDICQRTKTSRHFSYDDLQSLLLSQDSWQEIIMNFITDLSSSKRSNDVYDSVLVIVNRYIKIVKVLPFDPDHQGTGLNPIRKGLASISHKSLFCMIDFLLFFFKSIFFSHKHH
jgi:hypothetical protein